MRSFYRGQGATEYLVLLAVVLIVALVSVALLGFFPGMASDSQRVQSETYWRSASPIAITEWAAKARASDGTTFPYFRVRNNGAYPIRINGIVGADGVKITQVYIHASCGVASSGTYSISDYYYLASGEEKYFGYDSFFGVPCDRYMGIYSGSGGGYMLGGTTSLCANSTASPGTLILSSMGFEYIEYIDGQQITKREIGAKPLFFRCN